MVLPAKLASAKCIAVFCFVCLFIVSFIYLFIYLFIYFFNVCLTGPQRWLC